MGPTGVRMVAALAVVAMVASGCSSARPRQAAPPPALPSTTVTTAAAVPTTAGAPPTTAAARPTALSAFSSCASLLRAVKALAIAQVGPWGLPGGGAGGAGARVAIAVAGGSSGDAVVAESSSGGPASFSGTNVQEQGVDEPDVVKTDGRLLVALAGAGLRVVDVRPRIPAVVGTLSLPGAHHGGGELLLAGARAVVLTRAGLGTRIQFVDLADPARPALAGSMDIEGSYVSARLVSGVVRLVVTSYPTGPRWASPANGGDEARAIEANRALIRRSTVHDWLPDFVIERPGRPAVRGLVAPCTNVLRPKDVAGLSTVSVLTIDPADPRPVDPACVLGGGDIVYASPSHLYVTGGAADRAGSVASEIHQFSIRGRERAQYVASGAVPGTVLNQFSMSEHEGRLRVATTTMAPAQESHVLVLEPKAGRLVPVGQVGGLGRGERIYSVRFLGAKGYVVTFRQVDPLYVVDLADPRRPRVTGELKIPGYSAYLHPVSDRLLLGVGQDATEAGQRLGTQLSLFDVRDPARPQRLAHRAFEGAYSEAEQDHHAFLWWPGSGPSSGLAVLPLVQWQGEAFQGAVAVPVQPGGGLGEPTRLTHAGRATAPPRGQETAGDAAIRRSLVVGQGLFTLSAHGLLVSELRGFGERAWVPFG